MGLIFILFGHPLKGSGPFNFLFSLLRDVYPDFTPKANANKTPPTAGAYQFQRTEDRLRQGYGVLKAEEVGFEPTDGFNTVTG